MDVEKTGGAAFPGAFTRLNNYNEVVERSFQNGMTLRDYFAAKAPPPPQWWMDCYAQSVDNLKDNAEVIAQWAFVYADAMLAARGAP